MAKPDLNLLFTLDVLLAEGNVTRAARRLRLSPSAMSRALARLRQTTGDPLLVRAGRGLVPSPRALELRSQVGRIVQEAETALRPADVLDLRRLDRTFTIRATEGFVENFGAALLSCIRKTAPNVRLRFQHKLEKDSGPLRDGLVDLETGVVDGRIGPEVRAQALFKDRHVGVVRSGHPLTRRRVTLARYVAAEHVLVLRREGDRHPADAVLHKTLSVSATVGGFSAAMALTKDSDLVATVPERHTGTLRDGLYTFRLPVALPDFTVSLLWHPRMDGDPAQRWLRGCVRDVCR